MRGAAALLLGEEQRRGQLFLAHLAVLGEVAQDYLGGRCTGIDCDTLLRLRATLLVHRRFSRLAAEDRGRCNGRL